MQENVDERTLHVYDVQTSQAPTVTYHSASQSGVMNSPPPWTDVIHARSFTIDEISRFSSLLQPCMASDQ